MSRFVSVTNRTWPRALDAVMAIRCGTLRGAAYVPKQRQDQLTLGQPLAPVVDLPLCRAMPTRSIGHLNFRPAALRRNLSYLLVAPAPPA